MYEINLKKLKKYRLKDCPCKLSNSIDNIVCPCVEFCETGNCKCGVFKKIENKTDFDDVEIHVK